MVFHAIVTHYQVHSYSREHVSLKTAPAVYRNILLNLCGEMQSMLDNDAAFTMPDGGDMSIWNNSINPGDQSVTDTGQFRARDQGLPYHILVVEDDASLANLEASILNAHGYLVAIANNGEIAITILDLA